MTVATAPNRPPDVLLMSQDGAWHDAVTAAVRALGSGDVEVAGSPSDAMRKVMMGERPYTHLLLDLNDAPGWVGVFDGLTAGEAGSDTTLVRLGQPGTEASETPLIVFPDGYRLAGVLAGQLADPAARLPKKLSSAEILNSLHAGQIGCRFQPIVRMSDRRPVGLEALARLNHPVHGTLPPSEFIPQLEESGYSLALTEAVFRSCLDSIEANFLEAENLFLSINLPLDALLLPEMLLRIEERRAAAKLPPERMLIELTESSPVHDIPALSAGLERWLAIGYRLAIDDLGPDVVNQTTLVDMPFHTIKLDKQIVLRSRLDPLARRYLQRTVESARLRSLSIIAEGIEDEAMWDQMKVMGAHHAQGFMIARALPAAALPVWLEVWEQKAKRAT